MKAAIGRVKEPGSVQPHIERGFGAAIRASDMVRYSVMPLRDATPLALALQAAIHRRQTPSERFRAAVEMSDFAHNLALAGMKRRNPAYTENEAIRILVESLYASAKPRLQ